MAQHKFFQTEKLTLEISLAKLCNILNELLAKTESLGANSPAIHKELGRIVQQLQPLIHFPEVKNVVIGQLVALLQQPSTCNKNLAILSLCLAFSDIPISDIKDIRYVKTLYLDKEELKKLIDACNFNSRMKFRLICTNNTTADNSATTYNYDIYAYFLLVKAIDKIEPNPLEELLTDAAINITLPMLDSLLIVFKNNKELLPKILTKTFSALAALKQIPDVSVFNNLMSTLQSVHYTATEQQKILQLLGSLQENFRDIKKTNAAIPQTMVVILLQECSSAEAIAQLENLFKFTFEYDHSPDPFNNLSPIHIPPEHEESISRILINAAATSPKDRFGYYQNRAMAIACISCCTFSDSTTNQVIPQLIQIYQQAFQTYLANNRGGNILDDLSLLSEYLQQKAQRQNLNSKTIDVINQGLDLILSNLDPALSTSSSIELRCYEIKYLLAIHMQLPQEDSLTNVFSALQNGRWDSLSIAYGPEKIDARVCLRLPLSTTQAKTLLSNLLTVACTIPDSNMRPMRNFRILQTVSQFLATFSTNEQHELMQFCRKQINSKHYNDILQHIIELHADRPLQGGGRTLGIGEYGKDLVGADLSHVIRGILSQLLPFLSFNHRAEVMTKLQELKQCYPNDIGLSLHIDLLFLQARLLNQQDLVVEFLCCSNEQTLETQDTIYITPPEVNGIIAHHLRF